MTLAQQTALETIRRHGGYACKRSGMTPRWLCARYDAATYAYQWQRPVLSTRVMEALVRAGVLERAEGRGYGCCSFWREKEKGDG